MDARGIVERLGGQSAVARLIGKGQSTVAYWVKAGSIPARWHPVLLEAATRVGVPLTADDLVGKPPVALAPRVDSGRALSVAAPEATADRPFLFYASESGTVKVRVMASGLHQFGIFAENLFPRVAGDAGKGRIDVHNQVVFVSNYDGVGIGMIDGGGQFHRVF